MPVTRTPSRKRLLNSLSMKSLFIVIAATLATAIAVGGVSVYSAYDFLRARLDLHQPAVLEQAAARLTGWLDQGRDALDTLAIDPRPERLTRALDELPFFEALVVRGPEGENLYEAGTPDALPAGLTPPPVSPVPVLWTLDTSFAGPPLVVSTQLGDGSTLHGSFRREAIAALLASGDGAPHRRICIVDGHGRIRSPLCSVSPPAAAVVTKPLGVLASGGAHVYEDHDGSRVVGAARELGAFDWWLLVEEPTRSAFAPLSAIAVRSLAIGALLMVMFGFVTHRIAVGGLRPIRALYQGARRIAAGELDFALPPVSSPAELALLTRTFNEMTRKLQAHKTNVERGTQSLKAQNDELQRANEVLEQLSITDGLTRLHNHRFFQDHLTREIKRVSRTREPLSILVCDIDDFKRLNDRQGHKAGDELLVGLARILNESIRENDFLARYGGEEFVVLAPVTDADGAAALAEKVRRAVEESSFILGDSKQLTRVTLSIGVAAYKGNRRAFFEAADQALYRAKAAGKNCVIAAEES